MTFYKHVKNDGEGGHVHGQIINDREIEEQIRLKAMGIQ